MNASQEVLIECYRKLELTLRKHQGELAPFEERNALKALACLWQVANGHDMDPGNIYEIGA